MTRSLRFALLVLLSSGLLRAAAETPVRITPELGGALIVPASGWNGRVVLFFHGFADDMNGAGDLSKHCAEALAAHGIASLRINFRGEGDRMRSDIESTNQTRVEDAEAAYAYALAQPGVDKGRVGIVGWSLGTVTGIEIVGKHPHWIKSLVVWSAVSGKPFDTLAALPAAQDAIKTGTGKDVVPGWKTIITHRDFYLGYQGVDLYVELAKYKGAFMTLRGTNDFLPQNDLKLLAAAGGGPSQALIIGGADHMFNVLTPDPSDSRRGIQATVEWLEATL